MMLNALLVATGAFVLLLLLRPRVRGNRTWRATVTPLASIIGSGFLVLAPILLREFGAHAVTAMTALCLVGYGVGSAIRCNIRALDARGGRLRRREDLLDAAASTALAFAYLVSVCYYLNLFGAFAVGLAAPGATWPGRVVTTLTLAGIGLLGWWRGLDGLEAAETVTVSLKLAVIAALLVGMGDYAALLSLNGGLAANPAHLDAHGLRIACGLLITVQGFETSRYLEEKYDAATRIASMRLAQWWASAIYVVYVGLAVAVFDVADVGTEETAIIGMTASIAAILPYMLVAAALAAQFSAAAADTNGCGGLVRDLTHARVSARLTYVGLVTACIALTWAADIYAIISYASRAFALYYALQCALATRLSIADQRHPLRSITYAALTLGMIAVLVLGLPVE
ncbi:MAG: hypothetical protein KDC48_19840 [Planctomycetes bacterium]|nr:hypothetical protein [Planctomycetota bacterium]